MGPVTTTEEGLFRCTMEKSRVYTPPKVVQDLNRHPLQEVHPAQQSSEKEKKNHFYGGEREEWKNPKKSEEKNPFLFCIFFVSFLE